MLDGEDDHIASSTPLDLSKLSFTISMWVRRSSDGVLAWWGASTVFPFRSMKLAFEADRLAVTFFSPGNESLQSAPLLADRDAWHMYTATYNATTGLQRLYRDGMSIASRTELPGGLNGVPGPLLIGARAGAQVGNVTAALAAQVEDVRVYARALNEDEVASLAENPGSNPEALAVTRLLELTCTHTQGTQGIAFLQGARCARPVGTLGARGGRVAFDGLNDFARSQLPVDLTSKAWTMSVWVKRAVAPMTVSGSPRGWMMLASAGRAESNRGVHWSIVDDHLRLGFFNGTEELVSVGTFSADVGEWHHYAATFDGRRLMMYRDGEVIGARDVSLGVVSNSYLFVGAKVGTPHTEFFAGQLDAFHLVMRALDRESLRTLMAEGTSEPTRLHLHCTRGDQSILAEQWLLVNGAQCTTKRFCDMARDGIKFACETDADCVESRAGKACVAAPGPAMGSYALDLIETVPGRRFTGQVQVFEGQTLLLQVPEGGVQSLSRNANLPSRVFEATVYATRPTLSITSSAPKPTNSASVLITIAFSQLVRATDSDLSRLLVTTSAGSPLELDVDAGATSGLRSSWTFNATLASSAFPFEDILVNVLSGVAVNEAGAESEALMKIAHYTVDLYAPNVTITSPNLDPHNDANTTFIFTFTEAVEGFDVTAVLTDWPIVTFRALFNDETPTYAEHAYLVVVRGTDGAKVQVDVRASAVFDLAGNALELEVKFVTRFLISLISLIFLCLTMVPRT
jgi:hypothetical protein